MFEHRDQLSQLQSATQDKLLFVLGGGSNVVLGPELPSVVVKVNNKGIRLLDVAKDVFVVQAEAGEVWHDFVQHCVRKGWAGLENLALIPGTVGAAPVQNIGAYGLELEQRVHSVLAWHFPSASLRELPAHECGFAYRDSRFKRDPFGTWLIVAVRFALPKAWRPILDYAGLDTLKHPSAQQVFDAVCQIRSSKLPDPARLANAGSFFKNPVVSMAQFEGLRKQWPGIVAYGLDADNVKLAAAWLIDQRGWKGYRLGTVGVHARQALVLVNYGGAQAQDIRQLALSIKRDVWDTYGVELEQEPVNVS